MILDKHIRQQLFSDYQRASEYVQIIFAGKELNGFVIKYDYLTPTVLMKELPFSDTSSTMHYMRKVRDSLEAVLVADEITPELLEKLPRQAREYFQ